MDVRELIRGVIKEEFAKGGLTVEGIILFGSRARGDFNEDSDWDILVVVSEDIDRETYRELWYRVYRRLNVPIDLIIVPKGKLEELKDSPGFIYYYALREGVRI